MAHVDRGFARATLKWSKKFDQPDSPIRLGLECDYIEGYESWIETLAGMASWDYLIGSVHYIAPGWDVDNPKYLSRFQKYPVQEIWTLYWKHYVRCIESGLFDFVAHPDLPKKFGYRPPGDLRRYYQPADRISGETRRGFRDQHGRSTQRSRRNLPSSGIHRDGAATPGSRY